METFPWQGDQHFGFAGLVNELGGESRTLVCFLEAIWGWLGLEKGQRARVPPPGRARGSLCLQKLWHCLCFSSFGARGAARLAGLGAGSRVGAKAVATGANARAWGLWVLAELEVASPRAREVGRAQRPGGVRLKWIKAGVKQGLAGQETRRMGERGAKRNPGWVMPPCCQDKGICCALQKGVMEGTAWGSLPALCCRQVPG